MRKIVWGALVGAVVLAGCRTDSTVAMRSGSGAEGTIAKNPYTLERGLALKGTVTGEYTDVLVIEDKWGQSRYLRINEQTRYYQEGKQIGREYLAPGSTVRASFDDNNREMIAVEITVVNDVGSADPIQLPDRANITPY
ncbi:hypothetical protein ATI61_107243 [Archangium gephyra]|uniref:Lipoprotein n=1 Tax=Archangium gephyra TaxID=48 RepID=A0AAC8QHX7_9BACT|nr:hypothetical protein [Archangium gephyra]AKJ07795.1 Hypothetical protein AA314_09421 [Archangium gephyra]REG29547.1 hypothetical protein ATI61_107243 [Archangium gephyra]